MGPARTRQFEEFRSRRGRSFELRPDERVEVTRMPAPSREPLGREGGGHLTANLREIHRQALEQPLEQRAMFRAPVTVDDTGESRETLGSRDVQQRVKTRPAHVGGPGPVAAAECIEERFLDVVLVEMREFEGRREPLRQPRLAARRVPKDDHEGETTHHKGSAC